MNGAACMLIAAFISVASLQQVWAKACSGAENGRCKVQTSFADQLLLMQLRKGNARSSKAQESCRTAELGEECYETIAWAKSIFSSNPAAFPGLASNSSLGEFQTFYYSKERAVEPTFQPKDGGVDRVCRGDSPDDNSAAYYILASAPSLADCELRCAATYQCLGYEYKSSRCELWIRQVGATRSFSGFQCHTRTSEGAGYSWAFEPVDGGEGRACRGSSPGDNKASYYTVDRASALNECQALCLATPGCSGVEHNDGGRCEIWSRSVDASKELNGFRCYKLLRKKENGGCDEPPCQACRTAVEGEACFAAVAWAMSDGIHYKPEWYPGLSPSSTFEDFQMQLHSSGLSECLYAPCSKSGTPAATTTASSTRTTSTTTKTTTTTSPTTTASMTGQHSGAATCEDVWDAEAKDEWSTSTCGQRVLWYKSQGMSDQQAKAQVGLEYTACDACWPWPKFKAADDKRISKKRGIAVQNFKLSSEALANLSQSVSWGYIWDHSPTGTWQGGPDLAEWEYFGINFVPMVWGEGKDRLGRAETTGLPEKKLALLGFNEPNFPEQSNLSPSEAAALWPKLEKLAAAAGIEKIVSPAVNFANYDPIDWLRDFFQACAGCKVDAIAFHSYTCYGKYLKDHVAKYKIFNKPLWLTEFACSEASSKERLSAEGQMAYMKEAIPLLEQDEDVEMYAWFSYFEAEWAYPIIDGLNGDAGLVHQSGSLSALGEYYASFASTQPVDPPDVQTTTSPPCRTAQPGEECFEAINWAMTSGIVSNPEWYTGLSTSSSFEDFQDYFFSEKVNGGVCAAPACEACHTAVEGEACYDAVQWVINTGLTTHPDWYPTLSSTSSFQDIQEFLHASSSNDNCAKPCAAMCTSSSAGCNAFGVNVFGSDGFADDAAMRRAVRRLFSNGIRHFRVVNVGAWQDTVLAAIDDAAGELAGGADVSVQITSLFFDSPSRCSDLPSWMDFSLPTTAAKLSQLQHVTRILVQIDTCSICQSSELYCVNPTEQGFGQDTDKAARFKQFVENDYGPVHIRQAHSALPANVEFVIPYQNSAQSPDSMISALWAAHIKPLQDQGRKFHLEGTVYPFWTSSDQIYAPFPNSWVQGFIDASSSLGFDGFVISETGWPRNCARAEPGTTRPPNLENMCKYFKSTATEADQMALASSSSGLGKLMVYHWKFGPADDGSCGADTWGLFQTDGSFACGDLLKEELI